MNPGEPSTWSNCLGLCTGNTALDAATSVAGVILLLYLVSSLVRARAARGRGRPSRVVVAGLGGGLASLPFLASALVRICTTGGTAPGCRLQVVVPAAALGLALFAVGIGLVAVGRDMREVAAKAPMRRGPGGRGSYGPRG
ncbi:MAG TPA: hypothetical protein VM840_11690 [Actinomycetota bacterium]|nr:hypothetical protein [Actinomycetota bacterium]